MTVFFDKENLMSLINHSDQNRYEDCIRALKRQLNSHFNFSKQDIINNEFLAAWFNDTFTHGVSKDSSQIFIEEKFPQRPLKMNFYKNLNSREQYSSLYLINDDRIDKCIDKGFFLIGRPGEELNAICELFLKQDDSDYHRSFKIGGDCFKNWEDLEAYSLPLTDIIVVDAYILSNEDLIEFNLITFLKVIVSKVKSPINIILYTNRKHISIDADKLIIRLKKEVNSITGAKVNVTIISYFDQKGIKSKAEHDRTIWTNYYRIKSGDSFNYFSKENKVITKGKEIDYFSYGKRENYCNAMKLIDDIQTNIDLLLDSGSSAIVGDKKSNILYFSKKTYI